MNENINLVEILKDCPKGTKFYSSMYGELIYSSMYVDSSNSKIYFIDENSSSMIDGSPMVVNYYRDGRLYATKGECTIFPSKDQRDWSKFERFWDKPKRECFDPKTLQPFDRVLARYNKSCRWKALFFSHCYVTQDNENIYVCDSAEYMYCIPFDDNTKHLVGTKDEAPEYYRYWEN